MREFSAENPQGAFLSSVFRMRGWQKVALFLFGWTIMGLLQGADFYARYNSNGRPPFPWWAAIAWSLASWYMWGLLSIVIAAITRRLELTGKRWFLSALLHIPIGYMVAASQILLWALVRRLIHREPPQPGHPYPVPFLDHYLALLFGYHHIAFLTYLLIAFVCYALNYNERFHREERRRVNLQIELAKAQVAILKMQLHPHFLFNTLNAVTALIPTDPPAAERMIARLAELLRITLENEGVQEVPLRTELDFLERYLDIQRMRFEDRLHVGIEVADGLLDARVPSMILQPLVENAIKHGISRCPGPGWIKVAIGRCDAGLDLKVVNSGQEIEVSRTEAPSGHGLSNTRRRLQQMYGTRHEISCWRDGDAGFSVHIVIPLTFGSVDRVM